MGRSILLVKFGNGRIWVEGDLSDVQYVPQLREIGRHVAAARQGKEFVIFQEGVHQADRRVERPHHRHHALQSAASGVLHNQRPGFSNHFMYVKEEEGDLKHQSQTVVILGFGLSSQ
jgi:hypothetical protein